MLSHLQLIVDSLALSPMQAAVHMLLHTVTVCHAYIQSQLVMLTCSHSLSYLHTVTACHAYTQSQLVMLTHNHSVSCLHTVTACHACIQSQRVTLACSHSLSYLHTVTACHAFIQSQLAVLTFSHSLCGSVFPSICNLNQVTQEDCLACRAMHSIPWRIQIPLMTCMPVTGQYSSVSI